MAEPGRVAQELKGGDRLLGGGVAPGGGHGGERPPEAAPEGRKGLEPHEGAVQLGEGHRRAGEELLVPGDDGRRRPP